MPKPPPEFDYGFTTHNTDDDELVPTDFFEHSLELQAEVEWHVNQNEYLRDVIGNMYDKIAPLFDQLISTSEQPMINWPNRADKLTPIYTELTELSKARLPKSKEEVNN